MNKSWERVEQSWSSDGHDSVVKRIETMLILNCYLKVSSKTKIFHVVFRLKFASKIDMKCIRIILKQEKTTFLRIDFQNPDFVLKDTSFFFT